MIRIPKDRIREVEDSRERTRIWLEKIHPLPYEETEIPERDPVEIIVKHIYVYEYPRKVDKQGNKYTIL